MPELLKNGWTHVAFGEVVQLCRERSGDPEGGGFVRYVGLEHIDSGELKIRRWGDISDGTTFTSVFRSGKTLFGKRRAYQRKVAVADFDGVCSGDIYVLEPKNELLLPDLLPFICQTEGFYNHAVGTSAGSLSPRTNWESLASYELDLPPLCEQRRMAAVLLAIEQARSVIDAVRGSGDQLLRVLSNKEFVAGEDNRELLSNHYSIVSGQVDPRLPQYAHLPLIAPNHIESRTGKLLKLESAAEQAAISGKYLFEEGAVLYSKIRPGLVKATIAPCRGLCSADMYALMPDASIRHEYLLGILLSDRFTQFAVSGSMRTGIPKLNRRHLEQFRCRVPSINAQDQYLAAVSGIRSALERLSGRENTLTEIKKKILEALDHAV